MNTIIVANMKCGGCEKKITSALTGAGLTNVSIDLAKQSVSFEGDEKVAKKILSDLGYPEVSSAEADSILKKGKSYLSCATGRLS